eukprot:1085133-Pelagomonas_calceolata.AAC.1
MGIHVLTFSAATAVHKRARASYQRCLARQQELLQKEDEKAEAVVWHSRSRPTKATHTPGVAHPHRGAQSAHAAGTAAAGAAAAVPQPASLVSSLLKCASLKAAGLVGGREQSWHAASALLPCQSSATTPAGAGAAEGGEAGKEGLLQSKDRHKHASREAAPWSSFVAVQQQQLLLQRKQEAGAAPAWQQQTQSNGAERAFLAVPSLSGPASLLDCSARAAVLVGCILGWTHTLCGVRLTALC